ncbi:helix-turn-helix domain-containing protein [Eubacterium multiforme]|uniref:Excisionase family DNA binding protein n=1 Tax=Eubacterium multiforme TaxID=83339 RepID=A0ABT9UUR2_9FIRM|nr:helix-turn-helix domain-containing protein [Eubacterium multiforme]MDQ0150065.1 excisionase family DNA binding protein [Eubacterium multiforme]
MEDVNKDPYFEKFINLTVDFITTEVKEKLKEFKPSDSDSKLSLSPKEAAEVLGVGVNAIYKLVKEDDFPSYMVSGKYYVYKKGLEDWVLRQTKK